MSLTGKVAVVTGASRGIGRAIALKLAENGASVIVNYLKDSVGAERTLNQIKEIGGYASIKGFDVRDYKSCREAMDSVHSQFGKIDILINNAGVSKIGLFIDADEEQWNELIDINIKGTFNMTHSVLKHMLANGGGSIINLSSIWGINGASCESIYSATKGAVISFTKALAKEMGASNIRINAIAPGVIKTEMNNWLKEEERSDLLQEIALGRLGEPEDIGNLAVFLCSDESKYITGQTIVADGGFI